MKVVLECTYSSKEKVWSTIIDFMVMSLDLGWTVQHRVRSVAKLWND